MKTRHINARFLFLILVLALVSCAEDEIKTYDGIKSGLMIQEIRSYDQYGNPVAYQDSISYSFAGAKDDTKLMRARLIVKTIGPTVDYPRPYILNVVTEETTAVLDADFNLSGNDFIVRPYQASDTVYITLLRTAKLHRQTLRIKVKIEPNEFFEIPILTYKNSSSWSVDGPTNSATSYLIKFDEKYKQPFYWTYFGKRYFGTFSSAKFIELNKVMGWTLDDWNKAGQSGSKVAGGKFDFAARALQKHLQSLADAGTPVLDDDGKYMQLANAYAVDYSKYDNN
ncbi:MAG: DUF4843 domain-containing protein [Prevotella sp.]|nr:DUF4843 domain-containing protein [Prevotella sp.]